jgi:ACS family glucarate transporter-like MFS transporter
MKSRLSRQQLFVVGMMFALSSISYLDRTALSIASPAIMKEFGISETSMGTIFSAFTLGYALFMMPSGWIVDRWGARLVLFWMGVSTALLTASVAFVGKPLPSSVLGVVPVLSGLRFLFGACTAPLYPACARMSVTSIGSDRRAGVQGFIIAGVPLGSAAAPRIFPWLIARYSWRSSFEVAALITSCAAGLWWFGARRKPDEMKSPENERCVDRSLAAWKPLLADRNILLFSFAYFTTNYFDYIFFVWIFYYLSQVRQFGISEGAAFTTIIFLAMAVMMPLGGWVSDVLTKAHGPRAGRCFVPMAGLTLAAVSLYAGTLTHSKALTIVFFALAIGFASSCEGPFWGAVIDRSGQRVGAATAILNTGGNLGGVLAPILTPWIALWSGWSRSFHVAALVVLLGAVACWFVRLDEPENLDKVLERRYTPAIL